MTSSVEQGRAAFARRAWGEAFAAFAAAEGVRLDAVDQERLAVCAYLVGADERCATAWESAHRAALEAGDPADAARYAFWMAFCLMLRGQMAQAGGWLGRTERLISDAKLDCAASGYLLIPELLGALEVDPEAARDLAVRATALGERFDDADLVAFATLAHGQALLAMGDTAAGTARLDEVMVSVTAPDHRLGLARLWMSAGADLIASSTKQRIEEAMSDHPARTRTLLVAVPVVALAAMGLLGGPFFAVVGIVGVAVLIARRRSVATALAEPWGESVVGLAARRCGPHRYRHRAPARVARSRRRQVGVSTLVFVTGTITVVASLVRTITFAVRRPPTMSPR